MFDFLYLGSVPSDEECIQVESDANYIQPMLNECNRYKELLEKLFPIPNHLKGHLEFKIKRESYEAGPYYEVIIRYDEDLEEAVNFAFYVENNLPSNWNTIPLPPLKFIILSPNDMIEALKLYCEKRNIVYDPKIICWQIHDLDKTEGHCDSLFKVILN